MNESMLAHLARPNTGDASAGLSVQELLLNVAQFAEQDGSSSSAGGRGSSVTQSCGVGHVPDAAALELALELALARQLKADAHSEGVSPEPAAEAYEEFKRLASTDGKICVFLDTEIRRGDHFFFTHTLSLSYTHTHTHISISKLAIRRFVLYDS